MTNYDDNRFISKLDKNIDIIFEVGARYGDESIKLLKIFPNSKIYSFECNPLTIEKCKNKLLPHSNITFIPVGLGNNIDTLPFYSYMLSDGPSSFYKRIDFENTQKLTGHMDITTIIDIVKEYDIPKIDLLCMDVQGFELNILKGAQNFLKKIRYIIMEEPKKSNKILPQNLHSKYIGAPTAEEINDFLIKNGFVEIERLEENMLEDNVMYKNIL